MDHAAIFKKVFLKNICAIIFRQNLGGVFLENVCSAVLIYFIKFVHMNLYQEKKCCSNNNVLSIVMCYVPIEIIQVEIRVATILPK